MKKLITVVAATLLASSLGFAADNSDALSLPEGAKQVADASDSTGVSADTSTDASANATASQDNSVKKHHKKHKKHHHKKFKDAAPAATSDSSAPAQN